LTVFGDFATVAFTMPYKIATVSLLALFFTVPSVSHAATITKKPVAVQAVACVRCRSLAEGIDTSAASKAKSWTGTIIGINTGSRDVIITEATKLNRIKAFQQRNVIVDEDNFKNLDIGYRVRVTGAYDAKKRTITAASIEILDVPEAPITKTK
jgi:hypothetical protein